MKTVATKWFRVILFVLLFALKMKTIVATKHGSEVTDYCSNNGSKVTDFIAITLSSYTVPKIQLNFVTVVGAGSWPSEFFSSLAGLKDPLI